MTEHELKYDKIAKEMGIRPLVRLIEEKKKQIKKALEQGDHALNTIPIQWWDRKCAVAMDVSGQDIKLHFYPPWSNYKAPQSLAMRVCVLKHVAKFYLEEN
jgi:hypothetical protein